MIRYTILLIEDSMTDRRVYRRYLEDQKRLSLRVIEAPTGKEGLELCQREKPDCLIVDFKLPDMTATQLIPQLRQMTQAPIIFYTGQPEALAETHAYRDGALICLSKDFLSSESLLDAVASSLKEESLGQEK